MQSADSRCPISIREFDSNNNLSPQNLVDITRNSTRLELVFANDNFEDQTRRLTFYPNRDLIGNSLQDVPSSSTQGHLCHFESVTENEEHFALSACSFDLITGTFHVGQRFYLLTQQNNQFYLLPQGSATCDWGYTRRKRADEHSVAGPPNYYAEYIDQKTRYVELVFIADNSVYIKYDKNEVKVHDRLQSIANVVNSLYAPVNIRVTLVWADIWKDGDVFEVNSEADRILSQFLIYRKSILPEHPHDVAQFVTNIAFSNAVIGKAYKGTMCSFDFSGGVIMDHSNSESAVAATSAHEMGHNFGMEHDQGYPHPCQCSTYPTTSCIMAPASGGFNAPTVWSDCSLGYLQQSFKRKVDYCLHNRPKTTFGGTKCGNGIVEEGEDCDCASTEKCPNKCCIASTCKLAKGASCASGDCCDINTCQPKPKATVCRKLTSSCDLPEFCDGQTQHCPGDFFVQNGQPCPDDPDDFCYEGGCGSREKQCQFIWGPTGKNSVPECYAYNTQGSYQGDCGFNTSANRYVSCRPEDSLCGRLQCQHLSEKPEFGDPSTVHTAYSFVRLSSGQDVACRTLKTTYTGGKKTDPGMVPDGAKCGKAKMCINSKCTNNSEVVQLAPKCEPEDCFGHGICNNMGNCHCEYGYGGVGCNVPGYGGSVNSGPAYTSTFNPHLWVIAFLILSLIAFIAATVYCKRRKDIWLHKKIWEHAKKHLDLHSILVPVRKAPHPPRRAPPPDLNSVWGDTPQNVIHVTKPVIPSNLKLNTVIQSPKPQKNRQRHEYAAPYQPEYTVPPSHAHNGFHQIPHDPAPNKIDRPLVRQLSNGKRPQHAPPLVPPHGMQDHQNSINRNGSNSSSSDENNPTAPLVKNKGIVRTESSTRPDKPPPPPPHRKPKFDDKKETSSVSPKEKPEVPQKPPVAAKPVNVKNLAAKFDAKKANATIEYESAT